MFDSFPYDRWSDTVTDFWTWGGHNSTGTYVLTALGIALAVSALVGWVWQEKRALDRAAQELRESEAFSPLASEGER